MSDLIHVPIMYKILNSFKYMGSVETPQRTSSVLFLSFFVHICILHKGYCDVFQIKSQVYIPLFSFEKIISIDNFNYNIYHQNISILIKILFVDFFTYIKCGYYFNFIKDLLNKFWMSLIKMCV